MVRYLFPIRSSLLEEPTPSRNSSAIPSHLSGITEGQFYYTRGETSRKAVFRSLHLTLQQLTCLPCWVTSPIFRASVWPVPHHASPPSTLTPALPGPRCGFSTFVPAPLSLPSLSFSLSAQSLRLYQRSGGQEGEDGDPRRSQRKGRSQGSKTAYVQHGTRRWHIHIGL